MTFFCFSSGALSFFASDTCAPTQRSRAVTMSPRALLALLSLFASSSALAMARPEATPVGTTSGPTPSGDAVRRADEDAVVLLSSMTVTAVGEEDPGPAHGGEDASEDASRSWYVRCHALASPGETRLAGTLPVMTHHAARRAVVPLGFALGTVSPGNTDEVLACALFDLLPGVSRARVSRARVPLARFADAGDGAAALSFSFPRGSRTRELWVALELRCDACVVAAEGTPVRRDETSGAERDGARVASELGKKVSKSFQKLARRVLRRDGNPRRRDVRAGRPRRQKRRVAPRRARLRVTHGSSPREAQDERRAGSLSEKRRTATNGKEKRRETRRRDARAFGGDARRRVGCTSGVTYT